MNDVDILKGVLQKIVAVNANEKFLTVDLALALIGAYMLKKNSAGKSEWGTMERFLKYLRSECFKGKKKSLISDYGFSECALFIHGFLISQAFERKKGTLNSFDLNVITKVDDNGYLSFNDKTFNFHSTQQFIDGKPAKNYILSDAITEDDDVENTTEEDCGENIISEFEAGKNNDNPVEQETIPESPVLLTTVNRVHQRNNCMDNSPFVKLYDELIAADPEKRGNAKFVWQWFLTKDEYDKIKRCFADSKIPASGRWENKTTKLLSIYIGEFYKREYENNIIPFAQLGKGTPNVNFKKYKEICEKLNIEPYRKDNQAHLRTLYVYGGLPVHYISTKLDIAQSDYFINGLSKLLDVEDEIDISEGEEALGKVSNTALRESYQNGAGHSIYEYIQTIMTGKTTWDDSDKESDDFCDFIDKIKEASKKAAERKKFKLFYSLWTYFHDTNLKEFSLKSQIRFNPEEDGERHYAISLQRLSNWGITNPPAQFSLRMGDKEMRFTKCINGDYISWDLTDRIDLNILDSKLKKDDLLHSDFAIIFDRLNGESFQIKNDFNLPFKNGYLQFYTDDDPSMALWNSFKGTHSFLWSGLIFDINRYHLLSPVSITHINEELGWVAFSDCVAFKDRKNGKKRFFFNFKGRIYAKPSEDSLNRNIIDNPCLLSDCLLDGMAECTIGEERSHAYIVKSSNLKFDVFRVTNDERVNSNPIVEYKSAQEYLDPQSSWNQYSSENLNQGLYVFRLLNARYSTEVRCLLLPDNAEIAFQSRSVPYGIKFIDISNVSSEELRSSTRDNSTLFSLSENNVDSFNFTIGDAYGYVSLQTYHPKPQVHVYIYGKEINVKTTPVLIAYADEIEVKYVSSTSCNTFRLCEKNKIYKRLWDALTATAQGDNFDLLTQIYDLKLGEAKTDSSLPVRIYTQRFQNQRDDSVEMMLLDLRENSIQILGDRLPASRGNGCHDMLLFQSLNGVDYTDKYYARQFISSSGQRVAYNVRTEYRIERLNRYANDNTRKYLTDYAYQQFEIACEHKIYFAVFDSLLSMCWNSKKMCFLDKNKEPFKRNIQLFLNGYLKYTIKESINPSITGLKRLAREFLFDWKIIRSNVENSSSQQQKELYQELINKSI